MNYTELGRRIRYARETASPSQEEEYINMAYEAYSQGYISLNRLAELLEIPIEEAKAQVKARNIPLNMGVSSELELLNDINNA